MRASAELRELILGLTREYYQAQWPAAAVPAW